MGGGTSVERGLQNKHCLPLPCPVAVHHWDVSPACQTFSCRWAELWARGEVLSEGGESGEKRNGGMGHQRILKQIAFFFFLRHLGCLKVTYLPPCRARGLNCKVTSPVIRILITVVVTHGCVLSKHWLGSRVQEPKSRTLKSGSQRWEHIPSDISG